MAAASRAIGDIENDAPSESSEPVGGAHGLDLASDTPALSCAAWRASPPAASAISGKLATPLALPRRRSSSSEG
jgi:hypothetical protein